MGRPRTKSLDTRLSFLDFALLGGFGTLVAHEIAYVPSAFSRAPVAHGHLPFLWAVVSPLALLVVGSYIVRSLRSRPGAKTVSATQLGSVMAAFFLLMEVLERLVNGLSVVSFVFEGVMWAGLAVIPFVAAALSRLISSAVEAVVAWIGTPQRPDFAFVPTEPIFDRVCDIAFEELLGHSQSRRGPPVRIVY